MARNFAAIVVLALVFAVFYTPDTFEPEAIRGKRVLISGASSGIGEELAYVYSRLGAVVVLTARRGLELKRVADKCRELGAERVEYVVADMAVAVDREALVHQVQKLLVGKSLDHLILNHAVFVPAPFLGGAHNMTNLERDLDVNFVSYVDVATRCEQMLSASSDGGHVAVVTSTAGKIGTPLLASYSAQKFALHGFFTSWRQELRARRTTTSTTPPISVTLCVLGYISTDTANNAMQSHFSRVLAVSPSPPGADEAALAIVKGVATGAYEITFPKLVTIVVAVHKLFPGYLEDYYGSFIV